MTFFGALETIASREVTVNRASRKNREFDRKYDMSIHGNIYIFHTISTRTGSRKRYLGLTLLTKGIYFNSSPARRSNSSPPFLMLIRIVTV